MSYLKIGSWHTIARVDDAGWWTRCGRLVTTQKVPASDHLPLGEKSCETCLRLSRADEDRADPTNDAVPE
jgi:hypothetical protein